MSAVCILTPIVIAAWPTFSAAVVAAATSLGYQVLSDLDLGETDTTATQITTVELEVERSELVTCQLGRDQRMSVCRDGVTVTFSRDARGKASLCVKGEGKTKAELQALGEELSQGVVQQYVYQKLMDEMRGRGYVVIEEEAREDRSIRLKVRHWEN
jgi:hypothetical protein